VLLQVVQVAVFLVVSLFLHIIMPVQDMSAVAKISIFFMVFRLTIHYYKYAANCRL